MLSEHVLDTHQHLPEATAGSFSSGRGRFGSAASCGCGGTGGRCEGYGRRAAFNTMGNAGASKTVLHLFSIRLQKTKGNYDNKTQTLCKSFI